MFSQRNNPYCDLLKFMAKVNKKMKLLTFLHEK
jgi:hypothetical protein